MLSLAAVCLVRCKLLCLGSSQGGTTMGHGLTRCGTTHHLGGCRCIKKSITIYSECLCLQSKRASPVLSLFCARGHCCVEDHKALSNCYAKRPEVGAVCACSLLLPSLARCALLLAPSVLWQSRASTGQQHFQLHITKRGQRNMQGLLLPRLLL